MAQCHFTKKVDFLAVQNSLYQGYKLTSGGQDDPLLFKLIQAINHADEIEISVSFIQPSGLALLFDPLVDALARNVKIKILVSDYLYITSPVALRQLKTLAERGAETKLFQCEEGISFHMKAYIFIKTEQADVVEGCAFIGSNNISRIALTHAYEWCLRYDFSLSDNPKALSEFVNIRQQFHQIFTHQNSSQLSNEIIQNYELKYKKINNKERLSLVDDNFNDEVIEPATPNTIQEEALLALKKSRLLGFKRGLVVLATGMGKTWLSAFDVKEIKAKKVLFIAHREEILLQAEKTFISLFPQANTSLYNAKYKNTDSDFVFASIQTLGKQHHLGKFNPTHFDYIIVDEFHHASSPIYKNLLAYFEPKFMLGLTATPERSDQANILALCDNNLVFERNLVHGIESEILVPFRYYGVFDEFVNYEEIPWRNGRFDPNSLDSAFASKQRASHIYQHWLEKKQSRTLAFCVSTKHADFMAQSFQKKGIAACAVYNGSTIKRNEALSLLKSGKLSVVFSVDLFNEGTDLPAIDTILMLRPTKSKILFLQQLGRGLRQNQATNKKHLTVIDFIGNHNSFLNKAYGLLNVSTPKEVAKAIQQKIQLADGCYINYAPEIIDFWKILAKKYRHTSIEEYQELKKQLGYRPSASEFFQQGYELKKVREQAGSWFDLVNSQEETLNLQPLLEQYRKFLLKAVETTKMTKCFKAILLTAFLELDGFNTPPTTKKLAEKSRRILARHPDFQQADLPSTMQKQKTDPDIWHKYWLKNPITAFCNSTWFTVEQEAFKANITVQPQDIKQLQQMVQELVDLRLAEYQQRITKKTSKNVVENSASIVDLPTKHQATQLPFYSDLKIACGHFKTSINDKVETYTLPESYGHLESEKYFIARASGDSMNGGKHPIADGDLLLLEWITPTSAGSISNQVLAIEMLDETGDPQYLLRVVKKQSDGRYILKANNKNYTDKIANEQMRTFARLKSVIKPNDGF